jgi:hypothetical protein
MEAQRATRFRWSLDGPLSISHLNRVTCVFNNKFKSQQHAPASENLHLWRRQMFLFPFLPREMCVCLCAETPECVYDCARAELLAMYYNSWLTGVHEDIYPTGGDTAVLTPP